MFKKYSIKQLDCMYKSIDYPCPMKDKIAKEITKRVKESKIKKSLETLGVETS